MDRPMSRTDVDVKPLGFQIPGVDMDKLQERLQLPDQFCNTCTLREGTTVVLAILQSVCVGFVAFIMMLLIGYPEQTEEWWFKKFQNDFDFYLEEENMDLIMRLYPLWRPFAYTLIITETLYFFTGILVWYALAKKTAHPGWYLPWIIMTGILVVVLFGVAGTMTIVVLILCFYRDITVTWDLVPICLMITYGVLWFYGFAVVVAHYRRRCIVKYWKEHPSMTVSDGY